MWKVNISLGLFFAISHLKTHRQQGGNRSEAVEWRYGYTYIEVSCTVKAILIGHHTERDREKRKERRQHRGAMVESQRKGRKAKQNRCEAPPCGRCAEQQRKATRGQKICGGGGECQIVVKERREKRVRLLHTVQHARQNTTSLYVNTSTRGFNNWSTVTWMRISITWGTRKWYFS